MTHAIPSPARKFWPVLAGVALIAFSGCTATRTQKSVGETIDDGAITTQVKAALIADSETEARNINVDTRRGVVQLNGFVVSDAGRRQATQVARNVSGVTSVENNLVLKGEARTPGTVIDDGMITTQVKAALAGSPVTNAFQIKVETHDGIVQLGGWVNQRTERDEAVKLARAITGVNSVQDNLDVKK